MANLILTTDCQRKCDYCFAQHEKNSKQQFTWDNFVRAAEFVATGPRALNLLGGEPTLHPKFDMMLEYLIAKDYIVQVFTNGMVNEDRFEEIIKVLNRSALRENQLYFAININEYKYRTEKEIRLQHSFMDGLGRLVYPSFTIHDPNTDLSFLTSVIDKYSLDRSVRIGLAMPIIGALNKFLPKETYSKAGKAIVDLAESTDLGIILDCGFPLCMFEMGDLEKLSRHEKNGFSFFCGCPLDIYPDLSATNCYPLSKMHKASINNFNDIMSMYNYFEDGLQAPVGMYNECVDCQFFKKACFGGCKGHIRFPEK